MDTKPLWLKNDGGTRYAALAGDLDVEVLVIGAGITGVTAAYLLGKEGRSVALIDRGHIGGGDTGHTTAHLTYMTDTRLSELVSICGEEHAGKAWRAGAAAMEFISSTAAELEIECEWARVPGYLAMAADADPDKEPDVLRREAEWAKSFGFDGVRYMEETRPTGRPGIEFPDQSKFHPLLYLRALAEEASRIGVRIYEETSADEFTDKPRAVKANGHTIRYRQVVIATHVPLQGNAGTVTAAFFQSKLASFSTYAVAGETRLGELPEIIWSDTADPFHYLRVDPGETCLRLILGGGDYKTGQVRDTGEVYRNMEAELRRIHGDVRITDHWSGQVVETVDRLPYIGLDGAGQFVATGFSGNGITFGTLGGMMARDAFMDRPNEWERLFSPARLTASSLGTYLRENSDFPVRMITDRLHSEKDTSVPEAGEGKVIKEDGERVAVSRDQDGVLHRVSAICPHLGGVVVWNPAEGTWDCPCHGSRFGCDGSLIAGPAEEGLKVLAHQ